MPVYQLIDKYIFPDTELSEPNGLLAIGGDLSKGRLIEAYSKGIFPWYSEGQPIMWWSPNPRMVLFPNSFKRHKNLRKTICSNKFRVTFDQNFVQVIEQCSSIPRKEQDNNTWITDEMKKAFIELHKSGIAHSVEVHYQDSLVGGLYGLSLGKCFFGESMFHKVTDASKVALWYLVDILTELQFDIIDVQQETNHLKSLGATAIDRKEFLLLLSHSVTKDSIVGSWQHLNNY